MNQSPNGRWVIEVIAANAAAEVINTQAPPRVQVTRKRQKLVLSSMNLRSCPAFLIRKNKNEPRRIAQMLIKTQITNPRMSKKGCNTAAIATEVM